MNPSRPSDARRCSKCGAPLDSSRTGDVCLGCALENALEPAACADTVPVTPGAAAGGSGLARPPRLGRFGDYELLEEIARGGMGVVYKARQASLDRLVAIKMLLFGPLASPEAVQRFRSEAAAAASLQHPNIVAIHEVGFRDGQHFIAMDYITGRSLADILRDGPLPPRRAAVYVKAIAEAIHYAHEHGILHRDLKPSNVLIDASDQPRVMDFGLAKRLEKDTELTLSGQVLGSPSYMAPEQAAAHRGLVGKRSDVYSLGALHYHLLTGRAPFVAATVAETLQQVQQAEPVSPTVLNPHVPRDLKTICLKCLEKDPARRYQTAQELAEDLGCWLRQEPIRARPVSRPEKFWRWCRRKPLVASLNAAVAAVFLAGFAGVTWQGQQASKARDVAQQRLYVSLVREARATRVARRVGYRDEVFALLHQAHALDVPQEDLTELRREAAACLGDFVGLTPTTFTDFPGNQWIQEMGLDPAGRLAAFGFSDGTILLREMPSGWEVARLKGEYAPRSICFSAAGDLLVSVNTPAGSPAREQIAGSVLHEWRRLTDGSWVPAEKRELPGAMECVSTTKGVYLTVVDLDARSLSVVDWKTRAAVHRFEYPKEMSRPPRAAGDPSGPPQAALSPSGRFLALETVEPQAPDVSLVDVRDLTAGQRVSRLEPRLSRLAGLRFSADEQYVVCYADAGAVVFGMNGFRRVGESKEHFREGQTLAFAPNSPVISLPLIHQSRVRLWDLVRSEDIASFQEPNGVTQTAFAPNGAFLLTAGLGYARLYPCVTAEKLTLGGHAGAVPGIAFSPDGSHLASVGKDRTVKAWHLETGRLAWTGTLPGIGERVAYSPDGRLLATGDSDTQLIWLWDSQTGERLVELGTNAPGKSWSVQFSPDGRHLIAAGEGSAPEYGIRVWALEPLSQAPAPPRPAAKLVKTLAAKALSLVLASDGRHVAFVDGQPLTLCLWDFLGEAPPRRIALDFYWSVQAESLTPDGSKVYLVDDKPELVTLEFATGKKIASFPMLDSKGNRTWLRYFGTLCLAPDGTKLALSAHLNLGVEIWDPQSGRLLYSLPEQNGTVYWLAWSPDSRRLAISRDNGDIGIWNLQEVERVLTQLGLNAGVASKQAPARR